MRTTLVAIAMLALTGCGGQPVESVANNVSAPTPTPPPSVKLGDFELNQLVRVFGTEPYWTLDMGPGEMIFTDGSADEPKPEPLYWVAPAIVGETATYTTKNVAGETVVLTLTRKDCLEVGEPEDTVPLTAELKIGDKVRRGCAGPKPADEPDEEMDNGAAGNVAG